MGYTLIRAYGSDYCHTCCNCGQDIKRICLVRYPDGREMEVGVDCAAKLCARLGKQAKSAISDMRQRQSQDEWVALFERNRQAFATFADGSPRLLSGRVFAESIDQLLSNNRKKAVALIKDFATAKELS